MNTCNTCRFWNRNGEGREMWANEDDDYVVTGHRRCLRVIHGNGSSTGREPRELAMVCDGSGYAASLWSLPTFGCALHEPAKDGDE